MSVGRYSGTYDRHRHDEGHGRTSYIERHDDYFSGKIVSYGTTLAEASTVARAGESEMRTVSRLRDVLREKADEAIRAAAEEGEAGGENAEGEDAPEG